MTEPPWIAEIREGHEADARQYARRQALRARIYAPDTACPKCGGTVHYPRYCTAADIEDPLLMDRDHLHCLCVACGYERMALPHDTELPPDPW